MLTRDRADELAAMLDRADERNVRLRRDVDRHVRRLNAPSDERRVAAVELAELRRRLDVDDAEIEQARRELAAARASTPSVATIPVDVYTIVHRDTGERIAARLSKWAVIARIGNPRSAEAREEWIVIGWMREGRALREAFRVDAAEFWWSHHPPPGELT